MVLGMVGGQSFKFARRYGIPTFALTIKSFGQTKSKKRKTWLLFLLLISPLLSLGYGENSKLMKWIGSDWLVRIVYGFLLGLPFLVWNIWYAPIVLACAWSVRAGSLGTFKIGKKSYDILVEDMVRYFSLGVIISLI